MTQDLCRTVLVVDDDDGIGETISEILQDEGYKVVCAANGQKALDWLRTPSAEHDPCLILLDLMMPVMDGFTFRQVQKADPAFNAIPVVVISAHAAAHHVEADGFLAKPIELGQLLTTVRQYCCQD